MQARKLKIKRMTRAQIDALLQDVIAKAKEANADKSLISSVSAIRVFGSYLVKDAESFGDLDLAVRFDRKLPSDRWVKESIRRYRERYNRTHLIDELFHGRTEVARRLKARRGRISIHEYEEPEELGCDFIELHAPHFTHNFGMNKTERNETG